VTTRPGSGFPVDRTVSGRSVDAAKADAFQVDFAAIREREAGAGN
jgi:hypothetical protein